MIILGPVWVRLENKVSNNTSIAGKWIWQAPAKLFFKFADKLDCLVENGKIPAAKFARKDPVYDPFPYLPDSVLCIYTYSPKELEIKITVQQLLGFEPIEWKSEKETRDDWAPGGKLRIQYEEYWKERLQKK